MAAGSQSNITWDVSDAARPTWTCSIDHDDPEANRMRLPGDVADVIGCLTGVCLWFKRRGFDVTLGVDDAGLYFSSGWARCAKVFGFKKGMIIHFGIAENISGPGQFKMEIEKDTVKSAPRSAVQTATTSCPKHYNATKGCGFFVIMRRRYVYKTNATVWWEKWGDESLPATLTYANQDHIVLVHCYDKGKSAKIVK